MVNTTTTVRRVLVVISILISSATGYNNYYYTKGAGSGSSTTSSASAYGSNFFVDSTNNFYDGYQQAWRYLGWYVKCGYPSDRYEESEHSNDNQKSHDSGENQWEGNNYCQRYLIWAAYVDENYQGGGIGEYSFYDPYSQQWDFTACDTNGNGRCAPMDCHTNNSTTWKLMGVFKEAGYFGNDAFFEQLFKHEGICVWNDDDVYDFMSDVRDSSWTQGCVMTGSKGSSYYMPYSSDSGGSYLYIDLKPTWNGNMTHGLYVDSNCKTEYEGGDVDVDSVAAGMGLLYGDYLDQWNSGLEIFKVCQPCRAYDLHSGDNGGNRRRSLQKQESSTSSNNIPRWLEDGYDPNNGYFQCDDDAGYTNVNQCMKFRSHADLEVATWEDLVTATNQGGMLQVEVGGVMFGSDRMSAQQYEYTRNKRRAELAAEQKKAASEASQIASMRVPAENWERHGQMLMIAGAVSIIIMFFRMLKRCKDMQQDRLLESPLLSEDNGTVRSYNNEIIGSKSSMTSYNTYNLNNTTT